MDAKYIAVILCVILLCSLMATVNAISSVHAFFLSYTAGESFQIQIQDSPNLFIVFTVQTGSLTGVGSLNTTSNSGIFVINPTSSGTLALTYPNTINVYINNAQYSNPYSFSNGNSFTVTWNYITYLVNIISYPEHVSFSINGSNQQTPYSRNLIKGTYVLVFPSSFTDESQTWHFGYWNNNQSDVNSTKVVNLNKNIELTVTYVGTAYSFISENVYAFEMGEFIRNDTNGRYILLDSSKYKNHAVFSSVDTAPERTVGRMGYGLKFDGNDYAVIADSDTVDCSLFFTVSVWIKVERFDDYYVGILNKANEFFIAIIEQKIRFGVYDGSKWFIVNSSQIGVGRWIYILTEITNAKISLYINGFTEEYSSPFSGKINPTSNNLYIGWNFTGIIDELQAFQRVLSSEEKRVIMLNQIQAPPNYIFTFLSNTTISDVLMDYYNTDDNSYVGIDDIYDRLAQTFTVQTFWYNISAVKLKLRRYGLPIGSLIVSIKLTDSNGKPTGSDLVSGSILVSTITTNVAGAWYHISFTSQYLLQVNVRYAIVLRFQGTGDPDNYVQWFIDNTGEYTFGSFFSSIDAGSSWVESPSYDAMFETYGLIPKCGFVDNHIETPWAADGEYAKVEYYIVGFQKFHSLITLDQVGGTSANAYFKWTYSFYHAGNLMVEYSIKIRYLSLSAKIISIQFERYLPYKEETITTKSLTLNLNGTGDFARAWKVAVDGCNYLDGKSFQIRVLSDTESQKVMDENTGEFWWEFFFDLVDKDGNPRNIEYFDPIVKVTVLVQSDIGITVMIKSHTHLAWFVWLAIAVLAVAGFFGVAYVLTGGHLESIPVIGGAMQGITDWFSNLVKAITDALSPIGSWIINSLIGAAQPLLSAMAAAANWLIQQLIYGLDTIFGLFGWQNGFSQILAFLGSIFGVISQAFNAFVAMMGIVVNIFLGIFQQIFDVFTSAINTVSTIVQAIGWIWSQISPTFGWVADVFWKLLPLLFVFYCLWVIAPLIDEGDWHKTLQRIEDTVGLMWRIINGLRQIASIVLDTIYKIAELIPVVE